MTAADRKRVVLADAISDEGLRVLEEAEGLELADVSGREREALASALAEAHAVIVRSGTTVDAELLDAGPGLEVVGRAGVGVDNIDMAEATRRGIAVLNAPGGNTRSTAELTMALLLAAARNLPAADRSVREGRWDRKAFRGVQLYGKTLGILGLGRIGTEVALRGRAFGMEVVAHDPYVAPERAEDAGAEQVELEELLARSDFLTLHAPLTEATRGVMGEENIRRMKRGAYLVNAARGGLVDEEALARALEDGHLGGAALDVYSEEPLPADHPMREAPGAVLSPHLGAATDEARREVAVEIATSVRDALLAGDLRAALNAPRVDPERRHRLDPVLELAGRSGLLLSVLTSGRCRRLSVRYAGPYDDVVRPLAAAAVEGYLRPTVDRPLNVVNALYLAEERGIEVSRARSGEVADYSNYVELRAEVGDGEERAVGGALLGEGHPRIVRIDDFRVATVPRSTLLVLRNRDVPGVIGEVGTRLGRAGVNIAEYHQARRDAGGAALATITVDQAVPGEVLDEIRGLPNVDEVRQVRFDD